MTVSEIQKQLSELHFDYDKKKKELRKLLIKAKERESDMRSHKMQRSENFYLDVFKHLVRMDKKYCTISPSKYRCEGCPFVLDNNICVKNWLMDEFKDFAQEAQGIVNKEDETL